MEYIRHGYRILLGNPMEEICRAVGIDGRILRRCERNRG
jgi:hypothetical protein